MHMKFLIKSVLIWSLAIGAISASSKTALTIQDMIGHCKVTGVGNETTFCIGMANGVLGMMMMNSKYQNPLRMCPTSFVSNGQAIQIFLNWAEKNPTKWQDPAFFGFALALGDAYPCN